MAVRNTCDYNEAGTMGCAPELNGVADTDADRPLHVHVAADGIEGPSAKG